jgi:signal transduction histidine kinase/streptogramin lyase
MAEDHKGNIWVCSRGGLMRITVVDAIDKWKLKCFLPTTSPGMESAYTINITCDDNDDLWVAYRYNGFARGRVLGDQITWQTYPRTTALFGGEGVNQVYQDTDGAYWIATRGFGLMQFFPESDSVKVFGADQGLSHPYIFRIYEDRQGRMWIATANGGLCQFDRQTEKFACYVNDRSNPNSLSSNMVLAVSEDSKGKLWVCTVDGLNIMEETPGSFSVLTTMDGLPNDVIYAAIEDPEGMTWLSTNEGIVRMQYPQRANSLDVFDVRDGIPGEEFNQHAFLTHSSGVFLFGSIEGITVWNPGNIRASAYFPHVVLTDFLLFNESVPISRRGTKRPFTLNANVNDIDRIELRYDQNSIAFKFAALGYAHTKIGTYLYQMEGVDLDWIRSGDRRFASYPALGPGTYTFRVNVCNRDGDCNIAYKSLMIEILPPPWKTWWAYLIYIVLMLSALFGLLWIQAERSRAIEKARAAERDMFRKKMARDFHDEAGNKITLLSLLTDRARKRSENNPEVKDLLIDLQDQIQELRAGMRDFIWIMDPSRDTLFDTVVRFRDFAEKVCEQAEVSFDEKGRTETLRDIIMPGNVRRHFLLIFKEGLNNTLKYAEAHQITFSVRRKDSQVWVFMLEDDGNGFDLKQSSDGHGLGNMKARALQIGAVLDITSDIGIGTRVQLTWNPESDILSPKS